MSTTISKTKQSVITKTKESISFSWHRSDRSSSSWHRSDRSNSIGEKGSVRFTAGESTKAASIGPSDLRALVDADGGAGEGADGVIVRSPETVAMDAALANVHEERSASGPSERGGGNATANTTDDEMKKKKSAATRIAYMFAALPLSKLKIVVGKGWDFL